MAARPPEYDRGAICSRIADMRQRVAEGSELHTAVEALGLDLCPSATRAGVTTPVHVLGSPGVTLEALLPVITRLIDECVPACCHLGWSGGW
jgi:hypothetical protein